MPSMRWNSIGTKVTSFYHFCLLLCLLEKQKALHVPVFSIFFCSTTSLEYLGIAKTSCKILRVDFLIGTLQMTDQLKWCNMLLFQCFEEFNFSDGMLCLFHLVSTFLIVSPIIVSRDIFYKLDVNIYFLNSEKFSFS